jgi:hypothetical protein
MNKRDLKRLEKIWISEIDGHMWQPSGREKWLQTFVNDGLIEPVVETFRTPLGPMVCKGFGLTHLGRILYCQSCQGDGEE